MTDPARRRLLVPTGDVQTAGDAPRRLAEAEENDRRRIARLIHDGAAQQLTALGLRLQALADGAGDATVHRRARELAALVDALGRELHALALELRPRALDDYGLEAAVMAYVDVWSRNANVPVDVHLRHGAARMPDGIESALYRIVQEALANVARHSGARIASIFLVRRDRDVVLIVEDDGRAFDPEAALAAPVRDEALGLEAIAARAALLGGVAEIESAPGVGTTVFVRLPLAA